MLKLKDHPLKIKAHFKKCVVLTFAIKKEQLIDKIPIPLTLDLFNNKWAFFTVALVDTRALRPQGLPHFLGQDFLLAGYRIFVKYTNNKGKKFRGLYILKSETDKKIMELLGNISTNYNFSAVDFNVNSYNSINEIQFGESHVKWDMKHQNVALPEHSPFKNWKEAKRFTGPLPFTFHINKEDKKITIVQGVRQDWKPKPINIIDYNLPILNELKLKDFVLANAFEINEVPYIWQKGKTEGWI